MEDDRFFRFVGNLVKFLDQQTSVQFYYGLCFASLTAYLGMVGTIIVTNYNDVRIWLFSPLLAIAVLFCICGLYTKKKAKSWLDAAIKIVLEKSDGSKN